MIEKFTSEMRIQVLDKTHLNKLILALVKNGYLVSLLQDKSGVYAKLSNYYFKE